MPSARPEAKGTSYAEDSRQTRKISLQDTTISGAVSGFAATVAKQPIQRLKWIRQVDPGAPVPYATVLRRTVESNGVVGLFRGSFAAICRNVPHSALVYSIFPHFEQLAIEQQIASPGTFAVRFLAGYATLFTATLATHPLDTLRVRISVTQGEATLTEVVRTVGKQGGVRALYHGFGATLLGAGPRGALGFGVFETLKDAGRTSETVLSHPTLARFCFGYLAGFCAETTIYPLDTVRRRQQAFGSNSPLSQLSSFSALAHLAKHEGVAGMYKGLLLNLVKNPIATAVSFALNDLIKESLSPS